MLVTLQVKSGTKNSDNNLKHIPEQYCFLLAKNH